MTYRRELTGLRVGFGSFLACIREAFLFCIAGDPHGTVESKYYRHLPVLPKSLCSCVALEPLIHVDHQVS